MCVDRWLVTLHAHRVHDHALLFDDGARVPSNSAAASRFELRRQCQRSRCMHLALHAYQPQCLRFSQSAPWRAAGARRAAGIGNRICAGRTQREACTRNVRSAILTESLSAVQEYHSHSMPLKARASRLLGRCHAALGDHTLSCAALDAAVEGTRTGELLVSGLARAFAFWERRHAF